MGWQLELPYRKTVEERPATWQSSDGLVHACDGTTVLPGEIIGVDVPVHLTAEEAAARSRSDLSELQKDHRHSKPAGTVAAMVS